MIAASSTVTPQALLRWGTYSHTGTRLTSQHQTLTPASARSATNHSPARNARICTGFHGHDSVAAESGGPNSSAAKPIRQASSGRW